MNTLKRLESAQATVEPNPMESLPLDAFDFPQLRQGDTVEGNIVSISPNQILVDIHYKADAIVDPRELERLDKEFVCALSSGDLVRALVVVPEDKDGNVVISLTRAQQEQDWRQAEELLQSQDVFEGVVTGFNRGGIIVRVGRVRGFVPASQLSGRWQAQQDTEVDPEQRWAPLVGQTMQLKVVDVLNGIVTSIADFGAFVDLGGADGLIHLSELAWRRIEHPSEVLHVGQQVDVYVMNVDEERKRIALSLRRLHPEPWSVVDQQYVVGQVLNVQITRLTAFGAFAKIDDTIEGLIHISEMADYRIAHPKEIVHEGDEVAVRVIRVDPQRRRIGLSLRQASDDSYVEMDWRDEARAAEEAALDESGPDSQVEEAEEAQVG
ncbi:MAG: 30S ribosomal protein S1 [Chloroflexi bacterium ADurb.Bin325]|nr:MAG: 30S ribosomal protein S1 [Chloroflexi bacterium ADurb.Bin325]